MSAAAADRAKVPAWAWFVWAAICDGLGEPVGIHTEFSRRAKEVRDWPRVQASFLHAVLDVSSDAIRPDRWTTATGAVIGGKELACAIASTAATVAALRALRAEQVGYDMHDVAASAKDAAKAAAYAGAPDAWPRLRGALFTAMRDAS